MDKEKQEPQCIVDSSYGIFIGQRFIELLLHESNTWPLDQTVTYQGIEQGDIETLKEGPDNEDYIEVWGDVIDKIRICDKHGNWWILHASSDLFLVPEGYDTSEL